MKNIIIIFTILLLLTTVNAKANTSDILKKCPSSSYYCKDNRQDTCHQDRKTKLNCKYDDTDIDNRRQSYAYINGKIEGNKKTWYKNSDILESSSNYKNDKLHGKTIKYSKNGYKLKTLIYRNGVLISEKDTKLSLIDQYEKLYDTLSKKDGIKAINLYMNNSEYFNKIDGFLTNYGNPLHLAVLLNSKEFIKKLVVDYGLNLYTSKGVFYSIKKHKELNGLLDYLIEELNFNMYHLSNGEFTYYYLSFWETTTLDIAKIFLKHGYDIEKSNKRNLEIKRTYKRSIGNGDKVLALKMRKLIDKYNIEYEYYYKYVQESVNGLITVKTTGTKVNGIVRGHAGYLDKYFIVKNGRKIRVFVKSSSGRERIYEKTFIFQMFLNWLGI